MRERHGNAIASCDGTYEVPLDTEHSLSRIPKRSRDRRNCMHYKCYRECLTVYCPEHYPSLSEHLSQERFIEAIHKLRTIYNEVSNDKVDGVVYTDDTLPVPGHDGGENMNVQLVNFKRTCKRLPLPPPHARNRFKAAVLINDFIMSQGAHLYYNLTQCGCSRPDCEFRIRYAAASHPNTEFPPTVHPLQLS